ncbi:MAG: penicillin-binding protein 1C [Lentimicrobium sp.]|jgi:penicillin-binding protein 1C|nr:penicillin-binding protein 1C [Lentimicrobium sp.]
MPDFIPINTNHFAFRAAVAGVFLFCLFIIVDAIFPFNIDKVEYGTVIYDDQDILIHAFLTSDDKWRLKAEPDEITLEVRKAFIFKEDQWFYSHPGVNLLSVGRAMFNNLTSGRRTSGASTITMQLARLLDPVPRTFANKFKEMFRAFQLELHYSKDEILLAYLNLLPYGGNIEGVKAASMIYFDEMPRALSLGQVAMLTVIPNNPNRLKPGPKNELLYRWRNHWLNRFKTSGKFSAEAVDDALDESIAEQREPMPRLAPHFSLRVAANAPQGNTYSTLNLALQSKVETLARNYVRRLRSLNVGNLSVVVVNNKTMEVKAYLGSADFNDAFYQGQVDGVTALRSPGSALKPAVYALAIDKGLITPKMMITDVPVNFAGYRPENYDEQYRGKVTVEYALAHSLNVPAVELLDKLGTDQLSDALSRIGFNWIAQHRKHLGLSIILGGCGTTLEELTALYATFANGGLYRPLQFNKATSPLVADTLCSPQAAYMITEMLTGLQRPDLPNQYQQAAQLPAIAWKTGTSYGRRDGWAIGYNPEYTVGVWTGNFPGFGSPELNGADCAVPLLFNVFNVLTDKAPGWFAPPDELDFRLVCTQTGMVPDTFCHQTVMDYFIPGISPAIRCNHLHQVYISPDESIAYCRQCLPEAGYKSSLYPTYPANLIAWYNEMQIPYNAEPPHNPHCPSIRREGDPVITSLNDGAEYLLILGRKQQLMLTCNAENGVAKVYWYLNDRFYKSAKPYEKVFFEPDAGSYKVSCSDDRGRNSDVFIKVSFL